jgi:hypothetical protein
MANVKISNLPAETDINNILGFAGYNAGGTCKISGADLINTLPSSTPTLGDVLTAGDEAIDQEIFFKPTSDIRVLRLDKNGLSMNNFATDLLITANSGGRLFLNSNSNDVLIQALGTGQVVFNTAEIDLQSSDVIDSTSSAGSAGEVLSSLGAGNGTQWVTSTPTLQQVFNNSIPDITAADTSKKLYLSLGEIELEATQTGGGSSVATMTSADAGGVVRVQLALDSAAGSAGAGQGSLIATGTALLGSLDVTHVYAVDNDVTLSAGTNTLGGNTSNYLNMPAGINIVGGGAGVDIGQIELSAWKADVAVPVVNCGIKLNGALGDIALHGDGLGTPVIGDVLTAKNASGEVEWTTPSAIPDVYGSFQGIMLNPGDLGTTAKPQLIFNDPLTASTQAGFQIVPFDCEIETITMKWNGDTAPTIDIADGTTSWKIGKLTSNLGNPDTSIGTVNFTDLTPTLAGFGGFEDLEISNNNGDSGTFIYKQWNGNPAAPTNLPIALSADDILVFIIIRGVSDWTPASDEITVNFKYKLT